MILSLSSYGWQRARGSWLDQTWSPSPLVVATVTTVSTVGAVGCLCVLYSDACRYFSLYARRFYRAIPHP
ncbi:unnamed protein product [Cochlearia groenlandica]